MKNKERDLNHAPPQVPRSTSRKKRAKPRRPGALPVSLSVWAEEILGFGVAQQLLIAKAYVIVVDEARDERANFVKEANPDADDKRELPEGKASGAGFRQTCSGNDSNS